MAPRAGGAMVGYLRGDELQLMFPSPAEKRQNRKERADARRRRLALAHKATKKSAPPPKRHRALERLEKQLTTASSSLEKLRREERALVAKVESEAKRAALQEEEAFAPLQHHQAAATRERDPEKAGLELSEIARHMDVPTPRARELEEATRATVAFSRQHEELFVALDAGASRRGVLCDADARVDLPGAVYRAGDVEVPEARSIAACADVPRARQRLLALWAQKHWARSLPRLGLAEKGAVEHALKRQPRVVIPEATDALDPLERSAEEERRRHLWAPAPRRELLSATAPAKLMSHSLSAQILREELGKSAEFLKATDDRVRRDMERTLAMSSRAVRTPKGGIPSAFATPLRSPLRRPPLGVTTFGRSDATLGSGDWSQTALQQECAAWGARKLARVFRAMAFRIQLRGLAAWSRYTQYQKGRAETIAYVKLAAGRRLCRCAAAAAARAKKRDGIARWQRQAQGCRDLVFNAAAVEIERHVRTYRAKCVVEWRRRRRAATVIQCKRRCLAAIKELLRLRVEKRRNDAAARIQLFYNDAKVIRKARRELRRRRRRFHALRIQRWVRKIQAGARVRRVRRRRKRRRAAMAIQCLARGVHCIVLSDKIREDNRQRDAATAIQTRARGYGVRVRIKGSTKQHAAADAIERTARRYLARSRAYRAARRHAVMLLLNCARVCIARRRMAKARQEYRTMMRTRALMGGGDEADPESSAAFIQLWYIAGVESRYKRLLSKWETAEAAIEVQRVVRGNIAREALRKLAVAKDAAARSTQRLYRGYRGRKRFALCLFERKQERAALETQRLARGFVARRRRKQEEARLLEDSPEARAAREEAQRLLDLQLAAAPGMAPSPAPGADITEAEALRLEEAQRLLALSQAEGVFDGPGGGWPPPKVYTNYWEARQDYMAQQFELIGERVLVIQRSGRLYNWRMQRWNASIRIQGLYRAMRERRLVLAFRETVRLEVMRREAIKKLQARRRGQLGRDRYARKLAAKRRAEALRKQRKFAAITIQARARGANCREGIRREMREEALRKARNNQKFLDDNALLIQSAERCRVARMVMRKRRQERRAEEEAREKDRELELALDELKAQQETRLFAMRLQCFWRKKMAKRALQQKMEELVDEERRLREEKRFMAVARIQARARGNQGRAKFRTDRKRLEDSKTIRSALNRMKARQKAEMTKVEARMRHLDKFGPSEYLWSGVRGELGEHAGRASRGSARDLEDLGRESEAGATAAPDAAWVQQWDESAQATYWYNEATGEASWVDPSPEPAFEEPASEWAQMWDDEAQATYWYNAATGEASWVDPNTPAQIEY